ncbi:MAG TPA: sigma-70 family RNA polymerase sigma factor, partial [Ktedonobacteraceae bacterium]|nr:sigma-70 family RNA polymerase sigma factor [Ktedonobacteraceae bacterium]
RTVAVKHEITGKNRMPPNRRNATLITSANELSFEAMFTRYYPLIYQISYRCTGRHDEADDIAQEVFLRYYRMPPHATSDKEQRAWLCRVATNLSLNLLRTQQRRTHHEERAGIAEQIDSIEGTILSNPEEQVLAQEKAAFTRSVLAELPERQQAYLLLRSVGLSYAEIAQATGVAPASVGALLARAEREFRRKYHERTRAATFE